MRHDKIAFLPHETRGKDIIRILEEMGGKNIYYLDGSRGVLAIEHHPNRKIITNDWDPQALKQNGFVLYTIEMWEEKMMQKDIERDIRYTLKKYCGHRKSDSVIEKIVDECYQIITKKLSEN